MNCPTTETLEQLALGFLEDPAPVRTHAAGCAACTERLKALVADHGAIAEAAKAVRLPQVPKPKAKAPWRPIVYAAAGLLAATFLVMIFVPESRSPMAASGPDLSGQAKGYFDQVTRAGAEPREEEVFARGGRTAPTPSPVPAPRPEPAKVMPAPAEPAAESVAEYKVMAKRAPPPPPALKPPAVPAPPKPDPKPALKLPAEDPALIIVKDAGINPTVDTTKETTSTFGLDVDTASYTRIRDHLRRGELPVPEGVRVEECVNYFKYLDPAPETGTFAIRLEAAPSPFDAGKHLLRIGIKAKEIKDSERKDVVLTFVIDVSGSMQQENRLELVKRSLRELIDRLRPADRIGIVVYGSNARDVLPSTPVAQKAKIVAAIEGLHTEGSTNVEDGLRRGYTYATRDFDGKKTNRVVLCSDGVANNGVTDPDVLLKFVKDKAVEGIYLSTLGFGMGNYNDHLMERLADGGNGNYAYIDDLKEAKKIFTEKLAGMMEVVAQDAKLQVEFDPATVATFRLIGYENRHVENRDFRNDKVDAGEVGVGHHVTALYEVELKPETQGRLATVRIRYKDLALKEVVEAHESLGRAQVKALAVNGSASWRMAVTVAMFAEILRGSPRAKGVAWASVLAEAERAARDLDQPEDAKEFVELVKKAAALKK